MRHNSTTTDGPIEVCAGHDCFLESVVAAPSSRPQREVSAVHVSLEN